MPYSHVESDGANLALIVYLAVMTALFAAFAVALCSFFEPLKLTNPGLAAYKPPPGVAAYLPTRAPVDAEVEQPTAVLAAAETEPDGAVAASKPVTKPTPQKPKREAAARARKPERKLARRIPDEPRIFGYAQSGWSGAGYQRWF
jgi:hypothetical protein